MRQKHAKATYIMYIIYVNACLHTKPINHWSIDFRSVGANRKQSERVSEQEVEDPEENKHMIQPKS